LVSTAKLAKAKKQKSFMITKAYQIFFYKASNKKANNFREVIYGKT
jgi:hypothetical protein